MSKSIRVLIVDDEPLVKQFITKSIGESDEDVIVVGSVTSAEKALAILDKEEVDLLFTDITMPKMSGIELLAEVKSRYPQINVVLLTCHDDFDYARTAIKHNAMDYLLKNEISTDFFSSYFKKYRKTELQKQTAAERDTVAPSVSRPSAYSEEIRTIINYISAHYMEDLSLPALSGLVYMSPEHLSRRFRKEVGVTFSEYRQSVRLDEARKLLQTTEKSISDIAVMIGIPDISHFTKVFHQMYGCTPGEFRKSDTNK